MASKETIEFSKDFLLGTASSAYQIEGGWDADGKSPNIWDDYFHNKITKLEKPLITRTAGNKKSAVFGTNFADKNSSKPTYIVNGDIACDSYHKVDEDVKNLVKLGVDFYRFSISWARVLPQGDDRSPNVKGIEYYKTLIDKLVENNIQPVVVMYHWDLPSYIQAFGGWANPNIVTYFENYANFLYKTYGDKVKWWTTINEPRFIVQAYSMDEGKAPALGSQFSGITDYMAVRNIVLSHAAAYRIYEKFYKKKQKGEVSICLDTTAYLPEDPNNKDHQEAVKKAYDYNLGIFTQPLINGEFPKRVTDAIKKVNEREKINIERLIPFTEEEKKIIKGSFDFICFNYYFSMILKPMDEELYNNTTELQKKDIGLAGILNEDSFSDTYRGFTQVINWFVQNCNNPKLFITENGRYEGPDKDDSELKKIYHRGILTELDKALKNGVNIIGYGVWSFMDSLEWEIGYYQKFYGIYGVDYSKKDKPRFEKNSFNFFLTLFKERRVDALAYE
ncbi:lactase-phlorizin hydrolase-like [Sipha flava]|uniref:Lactase-phlorizin hydrolase-like n=2 Tax=Sipha flava TaxID=143950 RepID=A0A8B8FFP5_9HEMI|nr:lactase-phlorizin hydrolase-like [Sipha flava]